MKFKINRSTFKINTYLLINGNRLKKNNNLSFVKDMSWNAPDHKTYKNFTDTNLLEYIYFMKASNVFRTKVYFGLINMLSFRLINQTDEPVILFD